MKGGRAMSLNIGNLVATLSLNFSSFQQGLNGALAAARQVGTQLNQQFNRINQASNAATRGTRNLGMGFKDLGRIVSGILISQAFYSGIQAIKAATFEVAHFSSEMEVARVSFERMMGSQARAAGFIETMKDFAAVTDFTTEQTLEMSRRLMAMGFEATQVKSVLSTVTDEVAYLGGGYEKLDRIVYALGQIQNSAKLAQPEIRQLTEATVPATRYLKEAFNLTQEQLQEIGKLGIKGSDAVKAILQGMQRDSQGMAKVLSNTVRGMVSTIKDNLLLISEAAGASIFKMFAKYIKTVRDSLENLRSLLRTRGLGGMLDGIFPPSVATNIRIIVGALKVLGSAFMTILQTMKPLVEIVGGAFLQALAVCLPIIAQVANFLARLAQVIIYNVPFVRYLAAALMGLLIANVVAKAFVFLFAVLRLGAIFGFVAQMVQKLAVAIRVLYVALTAHPIVALITVIVGLLLYAAMASGKLEAALNSLMNRFGKMVSIDPSKILQPVVNSDINKSMEEFNKEFDKLADGTKAVGDEAKKAGKKVKDTFLASFDEVYQIPDKLGETNKELEDLGNSFNIPKLGDLFKDLEDDGVLVPINFDFPDFPDIGPLFPGLNGMINNAMGAIAGFFNSVAVKVEGLLGDIVEGLKEAVKGWNEALQPLNGVLDSIENGFVTAGQAIKDFVKAVDGLPTAVIAAVPVIGPLVALLKELPTIKKITVDLSVTAFDALTSLVDKFKELPTLVKVAVAVAVPVIGPVLAAIALIPEFKEVVVNFKVPNLSPMYQAIKDFNAALDLTPSLLLAISPPLALVVAAINSLPSIKKIAIDLTVTALDAIDKLMEKFATLPLYIKIPVELLVPVVGPVLAALELLPKVKEIAVNVILPNLKAVGASIADFFSNAYTEILRVSTEFFTVTLPKAFNDFVTWLQNNWKTVLVGALIAIAATAIFIFGGEIVAAIGGIVAGVVAAFEALIASVATFFTTGAVASTTGAVSTWLAAMLGGITLGLAGIFAAFKKWGSGLGKWFGDLWNGISNKFTEWGNKFSTAFSEKWASVKKSFVDTWDSLPKVISSYWDSLTTKTSNIVKGITDRFDNLKKWAYEKFYDTWNALPGVISSFWTPLTTKTSNIVNKISELFGGLKQNASTIWSDMWGSIKGFLNKMIEGINSWISRINSLKFNVTNPFTDKQYGFGFNLKPIPPLATGGIVQRETLARVGEGGKKEAVIPLERGNALKEIASLIVDKMGEAFKGNNQGSGDVNYFMIGSLIGDERSIRELERRLNAVRISESQRIGGVV